MSSPVRFWGTVIGMKPRLILSKFDGETNARCHGYLAVLEGTRTVGSERPEAGRFTIALGPATQERRAIAVGDLLRGDAFPVTENAAADTPADLYRVGTLRTIARAGDPGAAPLPPPDPPRTDPPLTMEQAEVAPRRALHPENLHDDGGPCVPCPYGTVVPVVRLTDPRDWRSGLWSQVPACLGPPDCPYYRAPENRLNPLRSGEQ